LFSLGELGRDLWGPSVNLAFFYAGGPSLSIGWTHCSRSAPWATLPHSARLASLTYPSACAHLHVVELDETTCGHADDLAN
jgi:hypothetical protein